MNKQCHVINAIGAHSLAHTQNWKTTRLITMIFVHDRHWEVRHLSSQVAHEKSVDCI